MVFSKVTMAVVATALALLAPAARAEPQDVLRTAAVGAVEALEQEMAVGDRDSVSELGSTYSSILEIDYKYVMTVSSYRRWDTRDSQSYFVCRTRQTDLYMTVNFSADPEDGDFVMQVAEVHSNSDAAKRVVGWYLSVLDEVPADTLFRRFIRLSVHPDKSKATIWDLTSEGPHSSSSKYTFLRVRDAPGAPQAKGMWLTSPYAASRDIDSRYLAVGFDGHPENIELK